jgi:YVTN family beta-propeller protein
VYVVDSYNKRISVIDGKNNVILKSNIKLKEKEITDISINPTTDKLYIEHTEEESRHFQNGTEINYYTGDVDILEGNVLLNSSNTFANIPSIKVGDNPTSIAINPNTNKVYVLSQGLDSIFIIDEFSNKIVGSIKLNHAKDVFYNSNNGNIYSRLSNESIATIDGQTDSVSIKPIGFSPTASLAVDTDNNITYAIDREGLHAIENEENDIVTINSTKRLSATALLYGNNLLYLTHRIADTVSLVSPQYEDSQIMIEELGQIKVGESPIGGYISPLSHKIYIVNQESESVTVIDPYVGSGNPGKVVSSIPVGQKPTSISANSMTNTLYVPNSFSNSVTVINGTTDTVITDIDVENGPNQLLLTYPLTEYM